MQTVQVLVNTVRQMQAEIERAQAEIKETDMFSSRCVGNAARVLIALGLSDSRADEILFNDEQLSMDDIETIGHAVLAELDDGALAVDPDEGEDEIEELLVLLEGDSEDCSLAELVNELNRLTQ